MDKVLLLSCIVPFTSERTLKCKTKAFRLVCSYMRTHSAPGSSDTFYTAIRRIAALIDSKIGFHIKISENWLIEQWQRSYLGNWVCAEDDGKLILTFS